MAWHWHTDLQQISWSGVQDVFWQAAAAALHSTSTLINNMGRVALFDEC